MVYDRKLRILGIAQKGTESGLTRIKELVQSEIDFVYLKNFKKHEWHTRIAEQGHFDGILSQCITHIEPEYRDKTVLFGLGSTNRKVLTKPSIRDYMLLHPLRDYWVNNNTFRIALNGIGINSKVMYRANNIHIPVVCPSRASNKFIVWYASPWNGCLKGHKDLSKSVISKLGEYGVKVFILPHDTGWAADEPHVIALGKADLLPIIPLVHGIVRFGELGDFGRSNYDFVAQGRWSLNYNVNEPWMESVSENSNVDAIVSQILDLIENDSEENRIDRWMYSKKYLSPKAMKQKWIKSLYECFYE